MKKMIFDYNLFRRDIIIKRLAENRLNLREAGKEIKISAATLSRIENSGRPNLIILCKILTWLEKDANKYFTYK